MTTIREEIYNRLTFFSETKEELEYNHCVNDIIKIFEKRIDEKIKEIDDGYYGWNTCNPNFVAGVKWGYERLIKEVIRIK